MSIVSSASPSYGPGVLNLQIEQGCDLQLFLSLQTGGAPWNLTGATISAEISQQWSPGASNIPLTITPVNLANGQFNISLPGSATLDANFPLPSPPSKTISAAKSRFFAIGGWALYITSGGIKTRVLEGDVTLDRDPASGG
jgi:hypothetical protein